MSKLKFRLDGSVVSVDVTAGTPLLYVLRNNFRLNSPHFGFGLAQCGACTVHLDGSPVRSCVLPVSVANGKSVTTMAGLGNADKPHPVQQAFIDEQVPQCGYCLNGRVMTATAVLEHNPAAKAQWTPHAAQAKPKHAETLTGRGIAYAQRSDTVVAVIAEIEVTPATGRI